MSRLATRIARKLGLTRPEHWTIKRTYAGHNQLAAGCWSFELCFQHFGVDIRYGGYDRASNLARAPKLYISTASYTGERIIDDCLPFLGYRDETQREVDRINRFIEQRASN